MLNGICYQPFPPPYDPSTANQTCIFFGSDISYDPMEPIWGAQYTSSLGSSCGDQPACRNDLVTLGTMGVGLIRLYDWDPRNLHWKFLDACHAANIRVLVPVSNYFLTDGFSARDKNIHDLINSFGNTQSNPTDYHPAIEAIIIGNEPRLHGFNVDTCVQFTQDWTRIEESQFSGWRQVKIGHPVDFNQYGGALPCWGFWDPLLQGLETIKDRLILCPQTYNGKDYLYVNAEGNGSGYVDQTWTRYALPILFTEIGFSRMSGNAPDMVDGQLSGSIQYATQHPERLLGTCFFQFADKVWMQGHTEGAFGAFEHAGTTLCTIQYGPKDFTHLDANCDGNQLAVDNLTPSSLFDVVKKNYQS